MTCFARVISEEDVGWPEGVSRNALTIALVDARIDQDQIKLPAFAILACNIALGICAECLASCADLLDRSVCVRLMTVNTTCCVCFFCYFKEDVRLPHCRVVEEITDRLHYVTQKNRVAGHRSRRAPRRDLDSGLWRAAADAGILRALGLKIMKRRWCVTEGRVLPGCMAAQASFAMCN